MVQRGERLRLAREPGETIRVEREELRQDLDRDVAIQLRVAGAIHLAHSARAKQGDDLIRPQARSLCQAHGVMAACQLRRIVTDALAGSWVAVPTRNRRPSDDTS